MGCNMCVVQKPEEQYRVMFQQVNGKDMSRLSQEQTLDALRSSRDPLVIQVLRKSPRTKGGGAGVPGGGPGAGGPPGGPGVLDFMDSSTQTDITFQHILPLGKLHPSSPPLPPLLEPYILSELPPIEHDYYDPNDYLDSSHHEVDRQDDLEYEEVELYKSSQQDKLGLTVCYRTDDEEDLGIYVGEVNPNSIAAKDGRIREGDRILQINGMDVQNREEAVAILTREDSTNISLLLARPDIENDNRLEQEELEADLAGMGVELLDNAAHLPPELRHCHRAGVGAGERGSVRDAAGGGIGNGVGGGGGGQGGGGVLRSTTLSNSQELDSGVGRTDESTRNEESSEHDLLGDEQTSASNTNATNTPGSLRKFRCGRGDTPPLPCRDFHLSSDSLLGLDYCGGLALERSGGGYAPDPVLLMMPGLTEEECERYRELLEIKCHYEQNGNTLTAPPPPPAERGRLDVNRNESLIQHEMALLEEELRHLEFKCRNILRAQKMQQLRERCMKAWLLEEEAAAAGGVAGEPQKHELSDITELPERSDKDSTSAYNTGGESCRSTPLVSEQPPAPLPPHLPLSPGASPPPIPSPGPLPRPGQHDSPARRERHNLNRAYPPAPGSPNGNSGRARGLEEGGRGGSPSPSKFRSLSQEGSRRGSEGERAKRSPKTGGGGTLERGGGRSAENSPYFSRRHRGARLPERYQSCMQLRSTSEEPEDGGGGGGGTGGGGDSSGQLSPMSLASNCREPEPLSPPRCPIPPPPPLLLPLPLPQPRMEWKVKVRSDGSRYVAKRPVRDRLLKARAMKIKEERSGMTTDDDAVSEMKMGRYWSKEERKQQLMRAREHRRRREFMMQSRLDCLREREQREHGGGAGAGADGGRAEASILELSHRKAVKKRSRRILDNWVTIQEMLAHGTRSADGKRVYNPLLSVTTV
ncbi:PDZ domain-containing protein 4-like [Amia ocellicauda]|uniref:PDZ domain-containing protein 4-like n=1 Tax=Amia ocellicauda TaxID=2972642 RepID=UPI003463A6F9